MILAVNGTLMRGLALNQKMIEAGGIFESDASTAPNYRLWSIHDAYPGMIHSEQDGTGIEVELWELPARGIVQLLLGEPEGLCLGRITLSDGRVVLGILAESYILEGCQDITRFGGWRKYIRTK
jgi:hypothetical protein